MSDTPRTDAADLYDYQTAIEVCGQLERELAVSRKGLEAVESLINESHGVGGLHLNGDFAPWSELRTGGRFEEWLVAFDDALNAARSSNTEVLGTGHLVDGTLTPLVGRCKVCDGKKWVKYDSNHARPCTACCDHGADGWWELSKYHAGFVDGGDNRCCRGCGELWRDLYPTNPGRQDQAAREEP